MKDRLEQLKAVSNVQEMWKRCIYFIKYLAVRFDGPLK